MRIAEVHIYQKDRWDFAAGKVPKMNALPLKPGQTPAEIIDDLIANHGLKTVLLAIGGKLIKRTRPPDSTAGLDVRGQLHIDHLDDRFR